MKVGPLDDPLRRLKTSPRKKKSSLEELIVKEAKRKGFREGLLSSYMKRKYGIEISENTIKAIHGQCIHA